MIFFPAAFLGANISFQAVDHGSAQVTMAGPPPGPSTSMDREGRQILRPCATGWPAEDRS